MFAGDGIVGQLITQTWDRVKFGGMPGSQQLAFYVNLKEIQIINLALNQKFIGMMLVKYTSWSNYSWYIFITYRRSTYVC